MNRLLLIPTPRPIGICAICVMAMCFIFGLLCKEPVLPLIGAVFVCCIVYCFLSLLFLALFHKKKAASLSVRIVPEKASIGENAAIKLSQKTSFFQMPGTLIRYKLLLTTKDNKKIACVFDGSLFEKMSADFQIARRGAYYGIYDELALQDIFGFFYTALKLPQDKNARLLAMPIPATSIPEMHSPANGENRRNETETRKTEELTEQRPYTPGDDPRRINWKLYSHAGELFVRQEEREPPPHSQFVLLIDTDVDASLYSFEKGVAAVDSLCSIALAALLEKKTYGDEVLFGYTGGDDVKSGSPAELSAYPAYTAIGC
ncbi:MAG: DUF58 domain-containing protein, partial [Spirochaetaceae bacterium]|nr:DUF58 domain-containing protein [Spirochaetaceae bacterium]